MLYLTARIVKTFINPANLLCLLLILGGFAVMSHDERWQTIGRRLCFGLAVSVFLVAVFPIGQWSLATLENRFPLEQPKRVDGIVLLGGDENPHLSESRKQASVHVSARRYITFAGLAREYPKAKLAYIGGDPGYHPGHHDVSTADVARSLMKSIGMDPERVIFEDKSQNTYENAIMGAELIKPKKEENWLLVTSASHMPRALLSFRKTGWHIFPAPTDYYTPPKVRFSIGFNLLGHLDDLTAAVEEYAGLLAYWLMGRIDDPWKK